MYLKILSIKLGVVWLSELKFPLVATNRSGSTCEPTNQNVVGLDFEACTMGLVLCTSSPYSLVHLVHLVHLTLFTPRTHTRNPPPPTQEPPHPKKATVLK